MDTNCLMIFQNEQNLLLSHLIPCLKISYWVQFAITLQAIINMLHLQVNNKEGADHCMEPLMMLPGRGGEFTGVAWCPSELSKVKYICREYCIML